MGAVLRGFVPGWALSGSDDLPKAIDAGLEVGWGRQEMGLSPVLVGPEQ
jgi:hypothetical protein